MNKILMIIAFMAVVYSCTEKKKPLLFIENKKIYLDTIMPNTSITKSFSVYNKGGENLVLEKYTSSCECTVLDLEENKTIKPGDSLLVNFKVTGYESDKGRFKNILCTFKSNSENIFDRVNISYWTK